MSPALAFFALAFYGLVLVARANAQRKLYPPMRAALTAFAISAALHSVTLIFLEGDARFVALAFWGIPHLLVLPLLLVAARRANKG